MLHGATQVLHVATPMLNYDKEVLHDTTQIQCGATQVIHYVTPMLHYATQLLHGATGFYTIAP